MLHILQSTFLRKTLLLTMIMVTVQLARAQHAVLHQSVGIVSDSAMSKLQGSGLTHTNSSQMLAAAPIFTVTPTLQRNYSSVRTFKKSGIKTATQVNQVGLTAAEVNESIAYTDGLGRGIQSVVVQGSPSGKDIIQAAEYDHAGRQARQYLPYTSSGTPGSFRALSLAGSNGYSNSEQYTFYQQSNQNYKTTAYPYAETVLEPTVFNRQEQGAPGAAWQPVNASIPTSGHTDKVDTDLSSSADTIKKWKITGNTILVDNSGFLVGLIKQSQKDANWTAGKAGTKETFTDLGGRVIAEKNYFSETAASVTYYVYDENITSRLRYVLAPSIVSNTFKEGDTTFNRHVYAYHYNDMGLVVEKKFPGRGWDHIVYNKKGQPVLTQDSVQRTRQEWNFVKYDAFGRIIFSGSYQNAGTRGTVQTLVDAVNVLWEKRDKATANGYTNVAFPLASQIAEVYTTNYYDDYDLPTSCPFKIMPTGCSPIADGLQTATLVKVLGGTTNLWTVSYYDQEGLPTVVKSQNNLGGTDELVSTYLFSGEVESVQRTSIASGVTTTVKESYEYDHMGRPLQTKQKINNQAEIILSSFVYNELGQLVTKKLHSIDGGVNFLQTIAYRFNERGWTTAINDANIASTGNTKFGLELKYEDALKKQYNGNIGQSKWKVARVTTSAQMSYDFEYDKVNRLVGAVSSTGTTKNGNYNEYVRYDQLGNIVSLGRNALISGAKQQIDSLKYTYDYNRNVRIDDISTSAAAAKNLGFKELKQQAIEYVYDGNGRVVSDANNGTTVVYNVVNMPSEIKFGTTSTTNYTYSVLGEKLSKKVTVGTALSTTAYNGGFQYGSLNTAPLQLQFIQTSEGRARYNGSVFIYEYDLIDHLGNVRATIIADPADLTQRTAKVIQENSYYSFGMVMPGADLAFVSGDKNNYLYNGKELQEELGQYDYGARFYDPAIGRWNVPDPLAENHYDLSPYHYVMGNPMLYIDPLGLDTAQVYGYIYNGDGLFKAQSAYEFLKNKAKRDSDFSEAFNSINSNGSNKRPLTPEELLAKRKAEEDRLRRIEYDAKRHNYGKGQTKDGINSVLDLAGKTNDVLSGAAAGVQNAPDGSKVYLKTIKPSNSYGFKVFAKASYMRTVGGSAAKKLNYVGGVIALGSVINTNMQGNDRYGDKTAVAVGKAIGGIVGGSIGANFGSASGGFLGAFTGPQGAVVGAVAGGIGGAYVGSDYGARIGGWAVQSYFDLMN